MPSYVRPGIRKCAKNRALSERGVADEFCEAVVDGHVKSFVAGVVGVLLRCVREPTFPDEWTVALV